MQHLNLLKLRLDVPTRWNSTYEILKGLLQYEQFCTENSDVCSFTEEDWTAIHDLVKVLGPVYTATMQLQESQLLLGDFYKLWVDLKYKLKGMQTKAADDLLDCLEESEPQILNHDIGDFPRSEIQTPFVCRE